jgi:hypothetical protein
LRPFIAAQVLVAITGHAGQRLKGARDRRALDLDDLHDAAHLHRLGRIEAAQRAAVDRRAGDDREQHVGQYHVLAVDRIAGGHVEAVDDRRLALADVAEVGRRLQAQVGLCRHRQLGRIRGDLAEAEGADRWACGSAGGFWPAPRTPARPSAPRPRSRASAARRHRSGASA